VLGVHARVGARWNRSTTGPAADHDVAVGTYTFWRDRYQLDPKRDRVDRADPLASSSHSSDSCRKDFEGIRKGMAVDVYVPTAAMTDACRGLWGGSSTVERSVFSRATRAGRQHRRSWPNCGTSSRRAPTTSLEIITGQLANL